MIEDDGLKLREIIFCAFVIGAWIWASNFDYETTRTTVEKVRR